MNYAQMDLDKLFVELRAAVIAEYETEDEEAQSKAVDDEAVIVREIAKREGAIERYHALLRDPHPSVRYRAALGIKKSDPPSAMRVFKELAESRPLSGVATIALHELMALEKKGVII